MDGTLFIMDVLTTDYNSGFYNIAGYNEIYDGFYNLSDYNNAFYNIADYNNACYNNEIYIRL